MHSRQIPTRRRAQTVPCLGVLLSILLATSVAGARSESHSIQVRAVPFMEGVRESVNPGGTPATLVKRATYKAALKYGIDLRHAPGDSVVAHAWRNGRLFYLFYKTLERAYGKRTWIVQRVHRIERNWKHGEKDPQVRETYLVEAFKLYLGKQKRPDQHKGDYGHQGFARREIVKTYEIGFADVADGAEGNAWPFRKALLFKKLQPYQQDRGLFDKVAFTEHVTWRLGVRLTAGGAYSISSKKLGIDIHVTPTDPAITLPRPIESSKKLVLERGVGLQSAPVDKTWRNAYEASAGAVVHQAVASAKQGTKNICFANGLIVNVRADGTLNTVRTASGFAGATAKGIGIGSTQSDVEKAYGAPAKRAKAALVWSFGDIVFLFDDLHRVKQVVIVCGGRSR